MGNTVNNGDKKILVAGTPGSDKTSLVNCMKETAGYTFIDNTQIMFGYDIVILMFMNRFTEDTQEIYTMYKHKPIILIYLYGGKNPATWEEENRGILEKNLTFKALLAGTFYSYDDDPDIKEFMEPRRLESVRRLTDILRSL